MLFWTYFSRGCLLLKRARRLGFPITRLSSTALLLYYYSAATFLEFLQGISLVTWQHKISSMNLSHWPTNQKAEWLYDILQIFGGIFQLIGYVKVWYFTRLLIPLMRWVHHYYCCPCCWIWLPICTVMWICKFCSNELIESKYNTILI